MTSPADAARRALAAPTRQALLDEVRRATSPPTAADLAAALGIDETATRRHLTALVASGLLTETLSHTGGRGRPARRYDVGPAAERFAERSGYERLASLLATVAETRTDPVAVGRAAAPRRIPRGAGDPVDRVVRELARDGFAPERVTRTDRTELVLHHCPYASVASSAPGVVCALHVGMIEGIASAAGVEAPVSLQPRDPRRAGCRVVIDASRS